MRTDQEGCLDVEAVTIHEVFAAYVRAGFTRQEALELVKEHLRIRSIERMETDPHLEDYR